ncbi:NAD(P)H-binding protein [bacterium]|nr:NAD(P)H-binding protein [bacterium]
MKIAVTTANGQLGRATIQALVNRLGSESVVGLARSPEKAGDLGVEVRPGDYASLDQLTTGFAGAQVAIIISSMAHPDDRIGLHRNAIECAKAAGVKKIVYTSIFGEEGKCSFDAIIRSNRQTEKDVQASGLQWIIARNGLYIDADLESLNDYINAGGIENCAGNGKCAYTSRSELATAYVQMACNNVLNNHIYTIAGTPVTQEELVQVLNRVFGLSLRYTPMEVEAYIADRIAAHGEHLGPIIAGIYEGIREGAFDIPNQFKLVCGRSHLTVEEMAQAYKDAT